MPVVEVRVIEEGGRMLTFVCPGCCYNHGIFIERTQRPVWTWNGDVEKPTIAPSILSKTGPWPDSHATKAGKIDVCHFYVLDGNIEFLGDCTHGLAGQAVPLPQMENDP